MQRYGKRCEQIYRSNFNRKRSECINWLLFNLSLAKRLLELIKVTDIVVADAYFSTSTFVDGIAEFGFCLVSRFRDNADLRYLYTGPRTGKRGRPKLIDGKICYNKLDHSRMEKLHIEGLEGKAHTPVGLFLQRILLRTQRGESHTPVRDKK